MEEIYQGYIHLTAEQLKLLCFLAYTGKSTTKQVLDSYAKGENITQANMSKLVSDIKPYLMSNYFFYDDDHQLMPQHLGPLLVYLLCEHPDWLRNFERKYSNLQPAFLAQLIQQLRLCIMGRYEPQALMMNDTAASRTLVALAHHRAFMPLLTRMTPSLMADFVKMVVEYQMEHDITDPDGLLVELVAYYSIADVYINPTYEDNFPTTNIEALACGTPVITYNTGGSPEAVDDRTGIVVEKGDVNGLMRSIELIRKNDGPVTPAMCRERAECIFNKDSCFLDYLHLYKEIKK